MRNTFKFFSILIFTLLIFACSEKEPEISDSNQIKFGTVCGWCAGEEFILVSSSKVEYHRIIPCGEDAGNTTKSIDYCSCEWDVLISSFDFELFNTLEYNECNVCADGCDEFLQISFDNNSHEIRYSPTTTVEGMEDLQELLQDLLETMRDMD